MDGMTQASPETTTVVSKLAAPAKPRLMHQDDDLIAKYIELRSKKDEIKKRHSDELAPFNEAMRRIENEFLQRFSERGSDNTKTGKGTAFQSVETSVTVRSWSETLGFIQSNEMWELLEARVNKTAALEVMKETGNEIPGVNVRQELRVNVRRPT